MVLRIIDDYYEDYRCTFAIRYEFDFPRQSALRVLGSFYFRYIRCRI